MKKTLLVALGVLIGMTARAQVTEFPYTQDFENGLNGWTAIDADGDGYNWTLNLSDYYSGENITHSGSGAIFSGTWDNNTYTSLTTDHYLVSPLIQLGEGLTLSWWALNGSDYYPETYSVYVCTTGNTVSDFQNTTPVYTHTFTSAESDDYHKYTLSLDEYAGQSVYVAFRHYGSDLLVMCIDDITIAESGMPEVAMVPSVTTFVDMELTLQATLVDGSTDGLMWTWTSQQEAAGNATMTANDNELTITYTAIGTDVITVTAANSLGSASAQTTVTVLDCGAITEFPWTESFENEATLECWTILNNNNDGYTWTRTNDDDYAHSGSYSMENMSYVAGEITPDDVLITPPITVPEDADGFVFEYYAYATMSSYSAEHVSVYVLTSNTMAAVQNATAVQSYTMGTSDYYVNNPGKRQIMLDDYAGQTIYIAIRHHDCTGQNSLIIDDVTVRQIGAPVVTVSGPNYAITGQSETFVATLVEGQTPAYSWASTMVEAGNATMEENGDTAVIIYSAAGVDTVTVTATNELGSIDVATIINVIDCSEAQSLPWTATLNSNEGVQCWLFVDNDDNGYNWNRSNGGGGGNQAYLSSRGGDDWAITPLIQMPEDADGTVLEWNVRGYNGCTYEVRVSTEGAELDDFTDSLFSETYTSNSYAAREVSLAAYSGQVVRVAFRHTDLGSSNNNSIRIRGINVKQTTLPSGNIAGSELVDLNEENSYAAVITGGSLNGISYEWSSVKANAGEAQLTANDSTMSITYSVGGVDTIKVVVTNTYGSATLTRVVNVRDCSAITEYPWTLDIADGTGLFCWTRINNNGTNASWAVQGSGANMYLYSTYNNEGPDDWAISQLFVMPEIAEHMIVAWEDYGEPYEGVSPHLLVLVSPTGSGQQADFTDTIYDGENSTGAYQNRTASLAAYAGQTIRIAFRHYSTVDDNYIRLRAVCIRNSAMPVVVMNGPSLTNYTLPATFTATLQEGATQGLTYTWSSTMADAGNATINDNSNTATVQYSTTGVDVVRVVATNNYGSDTAEMMVTVVDLSPVTAFPYSTTFEDDSDQNWMFVNDDINKWVIGTAANNGGEKGLYVSNDDGATNGYDGSTSARSYVYRLMNLEAAEYTFSYDYKVVGEADEEYGDWYDYMRVYLAPSDYEPQASTGFGYSGELPAGCIALDGAPLYESETWQNKTQTVNVPTAGLYKMVFVWVNDSWYEVPPAAAVDNVSVVMGEMPPSQPEECDVPTNVHSVGATQNTVTIDWTAGGDESAWQVQVDYGEATTTTAHPYVISGLQAGTTVMVKVRAVCGADNYSDWTAAVSVSSQNEEDPGNDPTGVEETEGVRVVMGPNPTSSIVNIAAEGLHAIEVVDMAGRRVLSVRDVEGQVAVDVRALAAGVYYVRLHGEGYSATRKLIVSER